MKTGTMDILYWLFEYGKVFFGYQFLMFLWPSVVFFGHLRNKTMTYRFAFCVTVPIVISNTAVLSMGLLHILDRRIIMVLFYGIFVISACRWAAVYFRAGRRSCEIFRSKLCFLGERYSLLVVVLLFGMLYFCYGAFQVHSYGYGDLYIHHEWIYGLSVGKVFSGGVYPEAMHCFVYCMNVLFGIRVYSILLFLQGIHVVVFLTAAFCLLRKVFYWRYTPVFVLAFFVTLDLCNADLIHSMFRLQITMPMEFGLHTVCLCALFLKEYLKDTVSGTAGKMTVRFYRDGNLFLFAMSLTTALMTHFHVVIMAVFLCGTFTLFSLQKMCRVEKFVPLSVSVLIACLVAGGPMVGALRQGIMFHESIRWAIDAMSGEESRKLRDQNEEKEEENGEETQSIEWKKAEVLAGGSSFIKQIYEKGYVELYGAGRAQWIVMLTAAATVICLLAGRRQCFLSMREVCAGYPPVILSSVLYIVVYAAPLLGLPDIIPEGRFFAPGHMMLLAVTLMPVDILFFMLRHLKSRWFLWTVSLVILMGIYAGTIAFGCFRGYLFYEMTRYNTAVAVTNSIIENYPQYSYTVVSPTDELYQIIEYGWHEELLSFVEKSSSGEYTIPSEYVFLYIEKRPLLYAQSHFFTGPSWLGEEKYLEPYWERYSLRYPDSGASQSPQVRASAVSAEEALKDMPWYDVPWFVYLKHESRTVLEAKAYEWCQRFAAQYPSVLKVYYEDEDFVCYYFRQDVGEVLYDLHLPPLADHGQNK